jgi:protoporphyrinogen IX oxidase
MDLLLSLYPWTKALHIISIIAWMAGMLYLPRLFVYHTELAHGSAEAVRFEHMERRLLRAIMNPAMILSWVFGLALVSTPGLVAWSSGWLHAKLLLVVLMTIAHHMLALWRKHFVSGRNRHSARFYRLINEVPTLLMIAIVVLVVVRPF